jgi:DNA-binding transcriptional ArsR family regulator
MFKALGDPVRWSIVQQIAAAGELACVTLEDTLPVSKPTISYHLKILHQAGLIDVRKSGRNRYYSVRRDALRKLLDDLRELGRGRKRADSRAQPVLSGPVRERILTW